MQSSFQLSFVVFCFCTFFCFCLPYASFYFKLAFSDWLQWGFFFSRRVLFGFGVCWCWRCGAAETEQQPVAQQQNSSLAYSRGYTLFHSPNAHVHSSHVTHPYPLPTIPQTGVTKTRGPHYWPSYGTKLPRSSRRSPVTYLLLLAMYYPAMIFRLRLLPILSCFSVCVTFFPIYITKVPSMWSCSSISLRQVQVKSDRMAGWYTIGLALFAAIGTFLFVSVTCKFTKAVADIEQGFRYRYRNNE